MTDIKETSIILSVNACADRHRHIRGMGNIMNSWSYKPNRSNQPMVSSGQITAFQSLVKLIRFVSLTYCQSCSVIDMSRDTITYDPVVPDGLVTITSFLVTTGLARSINIPPSSSCSIYGYFLINYLLNTR